MTKTFGCVGNSIKLRSGRYLDLANPKHDQFTFADIAGGLSKICRFGGQIDRFYSVAEHCYHCSHYAMTSGMSNWDQQIMLLHDAAEAFIGDIVKPLKIMLPDYAEIEILMEDCIAQKYDMSFYSDQVKKIDHAMLIAERNRMFVSDSVEWAGEKEALSISVDFKFWDWREAEEMFVVRAKACGIDVSN